MTTGPDGQSKQTPQPRSDDDLILAALQQERPPPGAKTPQQRLPERIGRYKIVRRIGAGGMGVVYEAEQTQPARRVALKVIRAPTADQEEEVRLFRHEIEVLGRLHHPCIARIYEADQTSEGQPYFVMELIRGQSLVDYADTNELPLRDRLALFGRVCEAVQYAHQHGVIHRDLKPANILVDDEGTPHVMDFGLARIIDPDMQVTRSILDGNGLLGTIPYMSPEQALGSTGDLDFRTDVYSLGVILYKLLTGTFPYEVCDNIAAVLSNIAEAEPERPSSFQRKIGDEVETIILRALAKDRDRRYPTAHALGDDLRRYLAGEPIEAKRDSSWYLLRKVAVRHSFATTVLALVMVTVLSFSAISGEYYLRARHAEEVGVQGELGALRAEQKAAAYQEIMLKAIRHQALALFLDVWHADRLDHARAIRSEIGQDAPEFEVMSFLLDDTYTKARLGATLGMEESPLLHLAKGERALKAGDISRAVELLKQSLAAAANDPLLQAFARTRLRLAQTRDPGKSSGKGKN